MNIVPCGHVRLYPLIYAAVSSLKSLLIYSALSALWLLGRCICFVAGLYHRDCFIHIHVQNTSLWIKLFIWNNCCHICFCKAKLNLNKINDNGQYTQLKSTMSIRFIFSLQIQYILCKSVYFLMHHQIRSIIGGVEVYVHINIILCCIVSWVCFIYKRLSNDSLSHTSF